MIIEQLELGMYYTNCYIVFEKTGSKAFIIDPAGEFEAIDKIIKKNQLELEYIILTHGHGDHIGAVEELREKYNCEVLINRLDKYMLEDSNANLTYRMGEKIEFSPDKTFVDNERLKVGSLELKFIHTPGHSKGSSCILVENFLFSGDTLFKNSIGRTDLEGGDRKKIISSIKTKLLKLPIDTIVYPGHGASTTINNEIIKNPFF
ncbi:MAG: MBL fold metallo-hydrolase [Bacillota bacterium]|nr:MBL fold metallo-hydrolase [Bacillota bacterium]